MQVSLIDSVSGEIVFPHATDKAQHVISGVLDSTGNFVPVESCTEQILARDSISGFPTLIELADRFGNTWRQTIVYVNGEYDSNSQWVKQ